jgi:hypothetical protein
LVDGSVKAGKLNTSPRGDGGAKVTGSQERCLMLNLDTVDPKKEYQKLLLLVKAVVGNLTPGPSGSFT